MDLLPEAQARSSADCVAWPTATETQDTRQQDEDEQSQHHSPNGHGASHLNLHSAWILRELLAAILEDRIFDQKRVWTRRVSSQKLRGLLKPLSELAKRAANEVILEVILQLLAFNEGQQLQDVSIGLLLGGFSRTFAASCRSLSSA